MGSKSNFDERGIWTGLELDFRLRWEIVPGAGSLRKTFSRFHRTDRRLLCKMHNEYLYGLCKVTKQLTKQQKLKIVIDNLRIVC